MEEEEERNRRGGQDVVESSEEHTQVYHQIDTFSMSLFLVCSVCVPKASPTPSPLMILSRESARRRGVLPLQSVLMMSVPRGGGENQPLNYHTIITTSIPAVPNNGNDQQTVADAPCHTPAMKCMYLYYYRYIHLL